MRADTAGRLLRLTAALLAAPPPHAPHKGSDIDSPSLTVKALRVVRMRERGLFFFLVFFSIFGDSQRAAESDATGSFFF